MTYSIANRVLFSLVVILTVGWCIDRSFFRQPVGGTCSNDIEIPSPSLKNALRVEASTNSEVDEIDLYFDYMNIPNQIWIRETTLFDLESTVSYWKRLPAKELTDKIQDFLYLKTLENLLHLYRNEKKYENSNYGKSWYRTEVFARFMLNRLNCKSPRDVRIVANSLYEFQLEKYRDPNIVVFRKGMGDPRTQTEAHPELHLPGSKEYISFTRFLSRALEHESSK